MHCGVLPELDDYLGSVAVPISLSFGASAGAFDMPAWSLCIFIWSLQAFVISLFDMPEFFADCCAMQSFIIWSFEPFMASRCAGVDALAGSVPVVVDDSVALL